MTDKKKRCWLTESNRMSHFLLAIPVGLFLTILTVIGLATGMEFKDREWGGRWDWLDWTATVLGGFIGQIITVAFAIGVYVDCYC